MYVQPVRNGCTLSGPTVRIPGKVSGMRTGEQEYVQPVCSQKFLFLELVALYLALLDDQLHTFYDKPMQTQLLLPIYFAAIAVI